MGENSSFFDDPLVNEGTSLSDASEPKTNSNDRINVDNVSGAQETCPELLTDKLIGDCEGNNTVILDLNVKNISIVPKRLLDLSFLEFLYLERNYLTHLPDDFFDRLPKLQWLDLRGNKLIKIPSVYIGSHKCLRNLLLGDNHLTSIPLELGLVETLVGLNVSNNPLEFPPPEIVEQGTKSVLKFLHTLIKLKSEGKEPLHVCMEGMSLQDTNSDIGQDLSSRKVKTGKEHLKLMGEQNMSENSNAGIDENLCELNECLSGNSLTRNIGRVESGDLHSQKKLLTKQKGKIKKTNSDKPKLIKGKSDCQSAYSKPNLPGMKPIWQKQAEERYLSRERLLNEKEDEIIQKRKDKEVVSEFRDTSKALQIKKDRLRKINGKIDFVEPVTQAPFDISSTYLKTISNEERVAQREENEQPEQLLPRSPSEIHMAEAVRSTLDKELKQKIQLHMTRMQERRKKPSTNPMEEMKIARQEIKIAEKLQRELEVRRKNLDYRFVAFTGDVLPSK